MENKNNNKSNIISNMILVVSTILFLIISVADAFYLMNVYNSLFHSHDCVDDGLNETDTSIVDEKPVIYLYGYNNEKVNVKLDFKGKLTCTYPKYDSKNGWNVTASKAGNLTDENGDTYKYLFWEGIPDEEYSIKSGYCIEGSKTVSFLEDILPKLGLSRKEMGDFITYWLPKMQDNKYNVISFLGSDYTDNAKLTVTPSADSTIRVFMAFYPSDEKVDIKEPVFTTPKRTLPMVVEWGGTQLKNPNIDEEEPETVSENEIDGEKQYRETVISDRPAADYTMEENATEQQVLLNRLTELQQAALIKQTGSATLPPKTSGHVFTDKTGNTTTFTDAEWNKLLSVWAYTGQAEELIGHHTIGELRKLL